MRPETVVAVASKGIEHGSLHKPIHTSVAFGYGDARQLASVFQGKERWQVWQRLATPGQSGVNSKDCG